MDEQYIFSRHYYLRQFNLLRSIQEMSCYMVCIHNHLFFMDMTNSSVLCFLVRLSDSKDYAYSGINMYSVRKNTEDLLIWVRWLVQK